MLWMDIFLLMGQPVSPNIILQAVSPQFEIIINIFKA